MKNPSREIKKYLNQNNIKNKVSTHHGTITVTILSNCSAEILDNVKNMNTLTAHGDLMDDTRYYTGHSVQFDYKFELSEDQEKQGQEIINNWSEDTQNDRRLFDYHIREDLRNQMGAAGVLVADKFNR